MFQASQLGGAGFRNGPSTVRVQVLDAWAGSLHHGTGRKDLLEGSEVHEVLGKPVKYPVKYGKDHEAFAMFSPTQIRMADVSNQQKLELGMDGWMDDWVQRATAACLPISQSSCFVPSERYLRWSSTPNKAPTKESQTARTVPFCPTRKIISPILGPSHPPVICYIANGKW